MGGMILGGLLGLIGGLAGVVLERSSMIAAFLLALFEAITHGLTVALIVRRDLEELIEEAGWRQGRWKLSQVASLL